MPRLLTSFVIALSLASYSHAAGTDLVKEFRTKYTSIYYSDEKDLDDFLWKVGGQRVELPYDATLAKSRVDRMVEKVENILDMRPRRFNIDIYLHRGLPGPDSSAYYENRARAIHINLDNATDGIVAHEIAHAVISQYFGFSPSSKAQEVMTQYVDRYLWSDYH